MHKLLLATPLIVALSLIGCSSSKSNDTTDATNGVPTQAAQDVSVIVVAKDATTGKPIPGAKIAFTGDLAESVLTINGVAATSVTLSTGSEAFYINKGETGSLALQVQAAGFLSANKTITVVNGQNRIEVTLVSTTAEVEGVDVAQGEVTTSSAGKVAAKQTYSAAVGTTDAGAALTINKDVVLTDAAGKPVVGALTVTIAAFTPSEATAATLPSELVVSTKDGKEAVSVVAAFLDINIQSESGANVTKLNPAAEVVVALDPDAKDPTTGEAFVTGDVLTVWSNSNGEIKYEGTTKVNEDGTVTLSISHLSSYWVSKDVTTCGDNAPKVILQGGIGADLAVEILANDGTYDVETNSQGSDTITLKSFPDNGPDLQINTALNGQDAGSKSVSNLACGAEVIVPVTLPAKAKLTVTVTERCSGDNTTAKKLVSAPVYVSTKAGELVTVGMTDKDGVASFTLPKGKAYSISASARSSTDSDVTTLTLLGDATAEFVFALECSELTGAE